MVQITFISVDGTRKQVESPSGISLMEAAVNNGLDGINAECGGSATCGTCHVYVAPAFIDKLERPEDLETDILEMVIERRHNSRLSCQVRITEDLDGLEVNLPASQGLV